MRYYDVKLDEEREAVVVEELITALDLNLRPNLDEGGSYIAYDEQLLMSLVNVLEYFVPRNNQQIVHQYKSRIDHHISLDND